MCIRDRFLQYAKKDEESGQYYMGESEFTNAIAPEGEDYVSMTFRGAIGSSHSSFN